MDGGKMGGKKIINDVKISVLALLLLVGSVDAATLTDPTGDWFTGSNGNPATGYDYTDIISANIEQIDSTNLKATIVVNANIPSFGWHGYRWFLDTDRSTSTGQTGYLFNDIGVDYWVQVAGSSGVPNPDVGIFRNGVGKIKTLTNYVVQGNKVEITFSPSDIGNPDSFYWIADSTDGVSVNDHASNSGHGTVTLSPSQPSNYFTVSNLNMNGQGNYVEVNSGATVSGTVSYTIWDSGCPGCIKQLVIGLDNDPKTCIFDSIPGAYPGKSGTASFSFTAPTSSGTYTVGWTEDAMYGCSDAKNNFPGKSKASLGTVKVSAPQVTTGSISVSSSPSGASIYLDGSYQTTTPYTISNVQAGSHTITLKLNGYQDWSTTVNVVAGQTTAVSGQLIQQTTTGSITVSSSPSGASIYLDGSYQSTTPYTINNVPAGSHTITLKLSGYQDWSTTVNVVAGQTSSVSAPLIQTPQKYALALYVYDSKTSDRLEGAKVYVDNSLKATVNRFGSPDPNVYLDTGTYTIRISKDGCTDESFSVVIPMQETKYVAINCNAVPPIQEGSITVNTNLVSASFTITGSSTYSGSGTSWNTASAPVGTYTITYRAVTGYTAPPSETKTLTEGGSITFSGTYYPPSQQKYALALYVYDSKTSDRLEGAKVYVDNSLKATVNKFGSPDPNVYLLPATYSIRISKDGCTDESFSVIIPMKETKYVAMNCNAPQNQQPPISPENEQVFVHFSPAKYQESVFEFVNQLDDTNQYSKIRTADMSASDSEQLWKLFPGRIFSIALGAAEKARGILKGDLELTFFENDPDIIVDAVKMKITLNDQGYIALIIGERKVFWFIKVYDVYAVVNKYEWMANKKSWKSYQDQFELITVSKNNLNLPEEVAKRI